MPTTKSAAKNMRTSAEKHQRNEEIKRRIIRVRRRLAAAITRGDKAASETTFRAFCSVLDRAAKKKILKSTGVDRRKSRAAARVARAFAASE